MDNSQEKKITQYIFKLPDIKSKHISVLISRIITTTFIVIVFFIIIATLIVMYVKINVTIDASGLLEPTELIYIHGPINGKIKKIFVKGGTAFHKGEVLVQFDSIKLTDQLDQLKNDLSKKMIEYEIKNKTISHELSQNQQDRIQAEASLLKANAKLREQMQNFFPGVNTDSFMVTYKKGSHIGLDYALSDIISARASLSKIQSQISVIKLRNLELQALLLEINELKNNISRQIESMKKTRIYAPFDGVVLSEDLEKLEGNYINEGSILFEISSVCNWNAMLSVNEKDVYELLVGDSVTIKIKVMEQNDDFLLIPGKVISISAEPQKGGIDKSSSGMYKVGAIIDTKYAKKYLDKFKRGFIIEAKIIKQTDYISKIIFKNFRKLL